MMLSLLTYVILSPLVSYRDILSFCYAAIQLKIDLFVRVQVER